MSSGSWEQMVEIMKSILQLQSVKLLYLLSEGVLDESEAGSSMDGPLI